MPKTPVSDITEQEIVPGVVKKDPILVADGVSRRFGGLTAVDVAHVEIPRGSIIFWVVLGLTDGLLTLGIDTGVLNNDLIRLTTVQTGPIRFIVVGVALMLLVIFRPQGIFGKKKDLHFA